MLFLPAIVPMVPFSENDRMDRVVDPRRLYTALLADLAMTVAMMAMALATGERRVRGKN
jgi:hypothetical protein